MRKTKRRFPFHIDAMVVLPDHIHAVWTLPDEDSDFALRWRLIKSHFSKTIRPIGVPSLSRRKRGEREVWQRRFWEHAIRDENDLHRHIEYCYINPVKHGHVRRVGDWPFSSFHRDVAAGLVPLDWGGEWDAQGGFGERT
jgi:putative transposase